MNVSSKMRKYRGLKIAFYLLGLPLFVLAVLAASVQFFGEAPFVGDSTSLFAGAVKNITGTQMYGLWLALAVWLIIAVVQIVVGCKVKSYRSKTMITIAVILVCMLVPVLVIDTVCEAKINDIAASASSDVTVKSYKDQLGWYRTVTSDAGTENGRLVSYTDSLEDRVDAFMDIYNVSYYDAIKGTTASNIGCTPIYDTYYKLSTKATGTGKMVNAEPNKDGSLTWEGVNYGTQFFAMKYTETVMVEGEKVATTDYVWYDNAYRGVNVNPSADKIMTSNGVYGESYYNLSGLFADGCVPGVDTSLELLNQYYEAANYLDKNYKTIAADYGVDVVDGAGEDIDQAVVINRIIAAANAAGWAARETYYTSGEGAALGVSGVWTGTDMYDFEINRAGDFELTEAELDTLVSALGAGLTRSLPGILDKVTAILSLVGVSATYTEDSVTLTIGSNDITITDTLTVADLQAILEGLGLDAAALADLVSGLGIAVDASAYTGTEWLKPLALDLLKTLYWYDSPVLLPVFDETFLVTAEKPADLAANASDADKTAYNDAMAAYNNQYYVSSYIRAQHEGAAHGALSGSVLIGSSLGSGYYAGSTGFTEAEVHQLQTDLSYQPTYYPIMTFRDMCVIFCGFAVLFTILYYRACERSIDPEYEVGKKAKKEKKAKKDKKADSAKDAEEVKAEAEADVVVEETTEPLVEAESEKEGA